MGLPDLTPLFYLAIFGLVCAIVLGISIGGWLGYHLLMAAWAYLA